MTAIAAGGMKGRQSQPTHGAIVASPSHRPNEEDEQAIRSEQVNNNQKRAAVVGSIPLRCAISFYFILLVLLFYFCWLCA